MKKLLILLIFLLILSGCTFTEDTKEYRDLSMQFDELVIRDLHNKDGFDLFFNDITKQLIPSNIKLHVKVYNNLGLLIENRFASGFIYQNASGYYHAMTVSSLVLVSTNQSYVIDVYDYLGNKYTARDIETDDNFPIITFKFMESITSLKSLPVRPYLPIINEPIFMIGNPNHTQNTILFGSYKGFNEDNLSITNIKSDLFAQGSAVMNVQMNLIGIQIDFNEDGLLYLSAEQILSFLESLESHES